MFLFAALLSTLLSLAGANPSSTVGGGPMSPAPSVVIGGGSMSPGPSVVIGGGPM
jgi:hypothetical protein